MDQCILETKRLSQLDFAIDKISNVTT